MAEPQIDRLAQTPANGDFARYVQQLSDARAAAAGLPVTPVQVLSESGASPTTAQAWLESGTLQEAAQPWLEDDAFRAPAPAAAPRLPVGPRGAPAIGVGRTRAPGATAAPAAPRPADIAPNEAALGRASAMIGNLLSFAGIALMLYGVFGRGTGPSIALAIAALVAGDILRKKGKRTPKTPNRS